MPLTNCTLTKLSSVWNTSLYIFSITSLPASSYPYPVVLFICIVDTLLSLNAFNTFAWLYSAVSSISSNTSFILSSTSFDFNSTSLDILNIFSMLSIFYHHKHYTTNDNYCEYTKLNFTKISPCKHKRVHIKMCTLYNYILFIIFNSILRIVSLSFTILNSSSTIKKISSSLSI